jgi:hypothetical protein
MLGQRPSSAWIVKPNTSLGSAAVDGRSDVLVTKGANGKQQRRLALFDQ